MNVLIEIIKYTLPSLIVLFACCYLVQQFLKREALQRKEGADKNRQKLTTPIRLHAYERMMLFVERINPENIVQRTIEHGMTSQKLHANLLKIIRDEFEHNLSQQIYVSEDCWLELVLVKDEMISLFNLCASKTSPQSPAIALGESILATYINFVPSPLKSVREAIRREVYELF